MCTLFETWIKRLAILLLPGLITGCAVEPRALQEKLVQTQREKSALESELARASDSHKLQQHTISQLEEEIVNLTSSNKSQEDHFKQQLLQLEDRITAAQENMEAPEEVSDPHRIDFKNGRSLTCRIVSYSNATVRIQINGGPLRRVHLNTVAQMHIAPVLNNAQPDPLAQATQATQEQPVATLPEEQVEEAEPAQGPGLTLSTFWETPARGASLILSDVSMLLSECATAGVDLDPHPELELYEGVHYLSTRTDAERILNLSRQQPKALTNPIFPHDSFRSCQYSGSFKGGFTLLTMVTDKADRIVAIQLSNESPSDRLWFNHGEYRDNWSVYNIIQASRKGNSSWKIAHFVGAGQQAILGQPPAGDLAMPRAETHYSSGPEVLCIDSELASARNRSQWNLKPRERNRLYLPKPMAELLLYRASEDR